MDPPNVIMVNGRQLSVDDANTINNSSIIKKLKLHIIAEGTDSDRSTLAHILFSLLHEIRTTNLRRAFVSDSDMTVAALDEEEFCEIRKLCIRALETNDWVSCFYRPCFLVPLSDLQKPLSETDRLAAAFNETPFLGNAHKVFHSYLTIMDIAFAGSKGANLSSHHGEIHYGKFCSVVQSSGTGKTRMFVELPDTRVFYINLRSPADNVNYPPRDRILADLLAASNDADTYERKCCLFFAALFQVVDEQLSTIGHAVNAWRKKLHPSNRSGRREVFERMGVTFDKYCKVTEVPKRVATITTSDSGNTTSRTFPPPHLQGERAMLSTYELLLDNHEGIFGTQSNALIHKPQLVIVIDEAAYLRTPGGIKGNQFVPADVLCRAIGTYSRDSYSPIWVVFASTEQLRKRILYLW